MCLTTRLCPISDVPRTGVKMCVLGLPTCSKTFWPIKCTKKNTDKYNTILDTNNLTYIKSRSKVLHVRGTTTAVEFNYQEVLIDTCTKYVSQQAIGHGRVVSTRLYHGSIECLPKCSKAQSAPLRWLPRRAIYIQCQNTIKSTNI